MYKAMLKLTNSFYRYLKLTLENVNCHRKYECNVYLTHTRKICSCVETVANTCFIETLNNSGQCSRYYSNIKKKNRFKKLSKNSNETKKSKPMSDSLQPTLNHVSYGGKFEISPDNSAGDEWRKEESSHNADRRESCAIPQDFRVWEEVVNKNDVKDGNPFRFMLLSYNVLAQKLLEYHPYLYTGCAPNNLKWKVRAGRLYDEIIKLAPDIICLQEVQASHVKTFYSKFEQIGYMGIFKQKTGQREDGCAIYYRQSLFEMIDNVTVEYYQPELPILNRDNIGMMVKLRPKDYLGPPIVIATTHLLYNPKRTDVRLAQMQLLLAEIDRFAYYNDGETSGHLPIILTGDFNSTPDSAVVKLLDKGHVSASPFQDASDWRKIEVTDNCQHLSVFLNRQQGYNSYDFCLTKIQNTDYRHSLLGNRSSCSQPQYSELFNTGVLSHSLNFISTYDKYKADGCIEATTFQDYWVTVDYIYFSYCSSLRLVERLRLPTAIECNVLGKLPNDVYGSDHLALAAVFELKPC